jgi:hypothetical protein
MTPRGVVGGEQNSVGVEAGGVNAVAVVASAMENHCGKGSAGDKIEHVVVTGGHVGIGEAHLAEAVVLVGIGTGDPENEAGCKIVERWGERAFQLFQVIGSVDVAGGVPRRAGPGVCARGSFYLRESSR